jgi:hypothetical protein
MLQERGESDRARVVFPSNFFDALNSGDTDTAFRCLGAEAKTPEGMLTPKAADYNKQGEWDSLVGLHLACLGDGYCGGLGDGYCGGRVGQDGYRVCGKAPGECTAKSHDGAKQLSAGWYISAGGRAAGFYSSPKLPLAAAGGPITARAAGLLVDGENPYKLTKGQWQFVFDAWNASKGLRVEVINLEEGNTPQDQESPTAGFEHVEATDAGGPTLLQDPAPSVSTQGAGAQVYASAVLELTQRVDRRLDEMDRAVRIAQEEAVAAHNEWLRSPRTIAELEDRAEAALQEAVAARQDLDTQRQQNQELIQRLRRLETVGDRYQVGTTMPTAVNAAELARCVEALFGRTGDLQVLRNHLNTFRERMESGGGIECHGVKFGSKHELLVWFDDKNIAQPAIFLDALAILSAIRAPVKHKDETTKEWESQKKIEFASDLDASMATSFETVLPSVLVGGKRATEGGGTFDWLKSYLKSFDVWKPSSGMTTGVSHQILTGIDKVAKRAEEYRALINEPTVSRLAAGLVMDSVTFCHDLVMFINEQHHELTNGTSYSKEAVWMMQLECLQTIVEELSEARERVADAGRHNPAYYLWGMLRAWQIQQRYRRNHFKNDPALNGVLVRRLIMQGGEKGVDRWAQYDAFVKQMEQQARNHAADIKRLQAAVKKEKEKE